MFRISGLKIRVDHTDADIRAALLKKLRVKKITLKEYHIVKRSLDARDKNYIHWNYIIDISTDKDAEVIDRNKGRPEFSAPKSTEYSFPAVTDRQKELLAGRKVCVVGSGPAGLFAAYFLSEAGFQPLLIERGEPVEDRMKTVQAFWEKGGSPDPDSNVQFGEGGAGTFSDGKLNTGVHDPSGRNRLVLSTFVKHGAPEHILYDSKPHIGSDLLTNVIRRMRDQILANGGQVLFRTKFVEANYTAADSFFDETPFLRNPDERGEKTVAKKGRLVSIVLEDVRTHQQKTIPCDDLVLAIGHSARDTFSYLISKTPLQVQAKPFAVGVRVQHLQELINEAQYGADYRAKYGNSLPPADYKLVRHGAQGENIYSFCMCPGGYVVNASSEAERLCVNGMSYSGRAGENANSAIVVGVQPSSDPKENIAFQQSLEEKAYRIAGGAVPLQRFGDFEAGLKSTAFGRVAPAVKGQYAFADLHEIFDEDFCALLCESIHDFGRKIRGFDDPDTLLAAVESRTSSPVRIPRDSRLESAITGLYPCGEGAGFAGGIMSAAIDGIKVFEEICRKYTADDDAYMDSLF